jgi:hypothetical protein
MQALVLPANGGETSTAFPTDEGAWYEITVAGTYSYNGRPTGLADCGGFTADDGSWIHYDAVSVDGVPSPCRTMPRSDLHVYSWRQQGTGRPMTFRVVDLGGGGDNLGALAVTVTRAGPAPARPADRPAPGPVTPLAGSRRR